MQHYYRITSTDALQVLDGEPVSAPVLCEHCAHPIGVVFVNLEVCQDEPLPERDAVLLLSAPGIAISPTLREFFESIEGSEFQCRQIRGEDGQILSFEQFLCTHALRIGEQSIRGGTPCDNCGGRVQLCIEPLFLRLSNDSVAPPLGYLLESPGIVLVREDIALRIKELGLDVDLIRTFFDGESTPQRGSTFLGSDDWSDL